MGSSGIPAINQELAMLRASVDETWAVIKQSLDLIERSRADLKLLNRLADPASWSRLFGTTGGDM